MEFNDISFHTNLKPSAGNYREDTTMMASTSRRAKSRKSNHNLNVSGNNRGSKNNIKLDESQSVVENILSAIEYRGENGLAHHGGPLTNTEIVKLSMLCTQQSEFNNRKKNSSFNDNNELILSQDIGFADVDADMMAQLVEHLEKHVALASQVDLVQSSYDTIQKLKKDGSERLIGCRNIDEVGRENKLLSRRQKETPANKYTNTLTIPILYVHQLTRVCNISSHSGFERAKDRNYWRLFPLDSRQRWSFSLL